MRETSNCKCHLYTTIHLFGQSVQCPTILGSPRTLHFNDAVHWLSAICLIGTSDVEPLRKLKHSSLSLYHNKGRKQCQKLEDHCHCMLLRLRATSFSDVGWDRLLPTGHTKNGHMTGGLIRVFSLGLINLSPFSFFSQKISRR